MADGTTTDDLGSLATVMAALGSTREVGVIAPGTVIADQYRIERRLGAGGMGVVYLARDQRLGRDVALKVGTVVSEDGLRRIEREAQAVAQLNHPNVVTVHQVGEVGGRVYIVMEYVAGGTARTWREQARRSWRDVIDLYLAAGAGLAAAHAAGLVHRDFKPDNVLVGTDGRARVADFGLARPVGTARPVDPDAPLGSVLTDTAAVVGTPAYMPPEQLAGEELDARADQYAFAAALWEALYDARPYEGDTARALRAAITTHPPRRATAPRSPAPRAIERALRRGMAADRDQRWPDLAALLAALRQARTARRRQAMVGAGIAVVGVIAGSLAIAATRDDGPPPCTDSAAQLAPVWNRERAARLAAHAGPGMARSLEAAVDRYAGQWIAGHLAACRATRVSKSQTEAMLDRRNLCLHRAAIALDATLGGLEAATPDGLAGGLQAVAELPSLAACEAVATLGAEDPLPSDAAARAAIDLAIRATAEADAAVRNDPTHARAKGEAALALARRAGWRPQLADTLRSAAATAHTADDRPAELAYLREAADLALASHSDARAAAVLADLASTLALDVAHHGEARQALRMAKALVSRVDTLDAREAALIAEATVAIRSGDYDAAIAAGQARVALAANAGPQFRGTAEAALAGLLIDARRPAEAVEHATAAIALLEPVHGADSPAVAYVRLNRARALFRAGDTAGAKAEAERSLAMYRRAVGPTSSLAGPVLDLLGIIARDQGDPAGARTYWDQELALLERDPYAAALPALLGNLGILDLEGGDLEGGLAKSQRALALLEAKNGPDSAFLIEALVAIGYATRGLGRFDESRAALARCVGIATTRLGPDAPDTVNAQIELGNTLIAAGAGAEAVQLLAPLVAVVDRPAPPRPPTQPVELRTTLASAQWAAGDRAAAHRTIADATRLAGEQPRKRALVEAWRATHGGAPGAR